MGFLRCSKTSLCLGALGFLGPPFFDLWVFLSFHWNFHLKDWLKDVDFLLHGLTTENEKERVIFFVLVPQSLRGGNVDV